MSNATERFEAGWQTAVGDYIRMGRTYAPTAGDSKPWASGYRLAAARIAYLAARMPAWMVAREVAS